MNDVATLGTRRKISLSAVRHAIYSMCTVEWSCSSSVCKYMNSHTSSEILNNTKFLLCICIILCWIVWVINRIKLLLILSFFIYTFLRYILCKFVCLLFGENKPEDKMLSCVSAWENSDEDGSGQAPALADAFSWVPWLTWSHERIYGHLWRL